jgi:ATP-dependent DNA ligase
VGVTSSFTNEKRRELVRFLEPYRTDALVDHPWRDWAEAEAAAAAEGRRMPGATSRWNRGKDLSWEALRPELVCEVAYDHLQGDRFRHGTTFLRWRTDRSPDSCRYDQLDETPPALLADLFA